MAFAPISLNPPKPVNYRAIGRAVWIIALFAFVIAFFIPVRTTLLRGGIVAGGLFVWGAALFLFWKYLPLRIACLTMALAPALLLLVPDRPIHTEDLRNGYVAALENYENTPFVWGGETTRGVDCSGLVRAALSVAELRQGIRTGNMTLLRKSASLWWNDGAASDLAAGYQGRTIALGKVNSLKNADYQTIHPGDLAVTQDGIHVLAYGGNKTWIEADPVEGKVVGLSLPSKNLWLDTPVSLVRWRVLENANDGAN